MDAYKNKHNTETQGDLDRNENENEPDSKLLEKQ